MGSSAPVDWQVSIAVHITNLNSSSRLVQLEGMYYYVAVKLKIIAYYYALLLLVVEGLSWNNYITCGSSTNTRHAR